MNKKLLLSALLSAGLMFFGAAGSASAAEGVVLAPTRLPASARTQLLTEIEKARKASPSAFKAVGQINDKVAELDAKKRGRFAVITPMLKALGPEALFPMLERIAVASPPRGGLSDAAWTAWRSALIEAVGSLRDGRSSPVLVAILDGSDNDFHLVRSASEALSKVGDDAAVAKLSQLAKAAGPKQKAVVAGMGDCHRKGAVEALAELLASHPEAELAKLAVRSLGGAGSSWAWKTPQVAASGEEQPTRQAAAKALVDAFVAYDGEVRKAAQSAILMVDDPSTPSLLQAAKAQAPQLAAELDRLAERFAKNPAR